MIVYRLSVEAENQLDDIWLHIARESGSVDTAVHVLDRVTDCFWLLSQQPYMGRRRDELSLELRSFAVGTYVILYSIENDRSVLIHSVFHGSRDIENFFHI